MFTVLCKLYCGRYLTPGQLQLVQVPGESEFSSLLTAAQCVRCSGLAHIPPPHTSYIISLNIIIIILQ